MKRWSINTFKMVSVTRRALSGTLQGYTDLQRPQEQPHTKQDWRPCAMAMARLQAGPCWEGTADKPGSSVLLIPPTRTGSFSYVTQGMLFEMANLL